MKKIYQKPEIELASSLITTPFMGSGDGLTGGDNDEIGHGGDGSGMEGDANQYSINLWDDGEE